MKSKLLKTLLPIAGVATAATSTICCVSCGDDEKIKLQIQTDQADKIVTQNSIFYRFRADKELPDINNWNTSGTYLIIEEHCTVIDVTLTKDDLVDLIVTFTNDKLTELPVGLIQDCKLHLMIHKADKILFDKDFEVDIQTTN